MMHKLRVVECCIMVEEAQACVRAGRLARWENAGDESE